MQQKRFSWPASDARIQTLPFDLYERYSIAAHFVRAFRTSQTCSVLDVGGHSAVMWPGFDSLASAFLPGAEVVVTDLHREPGLKNYAVASGAGLPFQDESFDFVLAQDTLEHVLPPDRKRFLHELVRVSRQVVLLTFPFDTPLNATCDRLIDRYIRLRKEVELPALQEHIALGLPDRADVRQWVVETGLPHAAWTHGNALLWLQMMIARNHLWAQGIPEFEQELDAVFNLYFAAGDYVEPCYRTFTAIGKRHNQEELEAQIRRCRGRRLSEADQQAATSLCEMMMGCSSSVEVERRAQHSINLLERFGGLLAEGSQTRSRELVETATRLAQASSEARHLQNLLEEQCRRAAGLETLLAGKTAQAQHSENLLREQVAHLETRLAEEISAARHLHNLLDAQELPADAGERAHHKELLAEQRRRVIDLEARLAEKASRAEHAENLRAGEEQRALDLETRLAEKTSQAQHFRNLLDEQEPRVADALNRLAEAASQLAHHKNLLGDREQRVIDLETRLAEKTAQAQHFRNLLDEQEQRAADALNRLAEAASQLAHHKNLLAEQKERVADLETRLAEKTSQALHFRNLLDEQESRVADALNRLAEVTARLGQCKEQLEAAKALEQEIRSIHERLSRFHLKFLLR